MKKIALYSLGGLILVGLAGFWVYSFLYGSPTNNAPVFADFNFFGGSAPAAEPLPVFIPTEPVVDVTTAALRQLTTKPVIGMRVIDNDGTPTMRYIEAGTGHIFDINLETGVEERVSGISVPNSYEAIVSENGSYVGITSRESSRQNLVVIDLSTLDTPVKIDIPAPIASFSFNGNASLLMTTESQTETIAKRLDLTTNKETELFRLPFRNAEILWSASSSSHYAYLKPAPGLHSALYEIKGSSIIRTPINGTGLSALVQNSTIFFSVFLDSTNLQTYKWEGGNVSDITFSSIMDKCVLGQTATLFCGTSLTEIPANMPAAWYMGEHTFTDRLWRYDAREVSSQLVDPQIVAGRSIDMKQLALSPDESMVYFINNIDQTLWLYEL